MTQLYIIRHAKRFGEKQAIIAGMAAPRVRMIVLLSLRTRLGWRGCLTG